ncbi:MAG: acyl carrier protein [Deltaproteobacteria bacterium]|nr:acyl carrier protein [Deltaproteobacteria bacterium]
MRDRVRKFIFDNFLFGADEGSLKDDDSFLEQGIIDSTGILELVAFLGEQFNIQINDDELMPENLDSVNCIVNFITRKKQPA